jgi:hypothetical protein
MAVLKQKNLKIALYDYKGDLENEDLHVRATWDFDHNDVQVHLDVMTAGANTCWRTTEKSMTKLGDFIRENFGTNDEEYQVPSSLTNLYRDLSFEADKMADERPEEASYWKGRASAFAAAADYSEA